MTGCWLVLLRLLRRPRMTSDEGDVMPADSTDSVNLIAAERARQVAAEGWTPEHDDEHTGGELLWAARCYMAAAQWPKRSDLQADASPLDWPWDDGWNPSDPVRNLVKAGALVAAEIDRLLRSEGSDIKPLTHTDLAIARLEARER